MTLRLLFVDDDEYLLEGLRRLLYATGSEWEMAFCCNPVEALERCLAEPFDVVISDMRMPQMDGAELLYQVRDRRPETVRIILSGQSEKEATIRYLGPAHQFLDKPCDVDVLRRTVQRACVLRDHIHGPAVHAVTDRLQLPAGVPKDVMQLTELLSLPHIAVEEVSRLIEQDVTLWTKLLQVVNAAGGQAGQMVSSPLQAMTLVGVEVLRPLILSTCILNELTRGILSEGEQAAVISHGARVGFHARAILDYENFDCDTLEQTLIGGILHDVGKLLLLDQLPEPWREAERLAVDQCLPMWEAECQVFQTTHAEIGAYLLEHWGLPHTTVEAVAFHHRPQRAADTDITPLVATHVANAAVHQRQFGPDFPEVQLDRLLLDSLITADKLNCWMQLDPRPEALIAAGL